MDMYTIYYFFLSPADAASEYLSRKRVFFMLLLRGQGPNALNLHLQMCNTCRKTNSPGSGAAALKFDVTEVLQEVSNAVCAAREEVCARIRVSNCLLASKEEVREQELALAKVAWQMASASRIVLFCFSVFFCIFIFFLFVGSLSLSPSLCLVLAFALSLCFSLPLSLSLSLASVSVCLHLCAWAPSRFGCLHVWEKSLCVHC